MDAPSPDPSPAPAPNPPPGPALTSEQSAAVHAAGDVLVMAGAGTGKTSTLIARVLHQLESATQPNLAGILMVTFTEAAAAEMRHRLRAALTQKLLSTPSNPAHSRLLAQIDSAWIGTLHSACYRLVRDHFHDLGIDPNPRIADDSDSHRWKLESLNATLWSALDPNQSPIPNLRPALQTLFRNDLDALRSSILKLFDYARSLPAPTDWIQHQKELWSKPTPELWRQQLHDAIRGWAEGMISSLRSIPTDNTNAQRCLHALRRLASLSTGHPDAPVALAQILHCDQDWPKGRKTIDRAPLAALFDQAAFLHTQYPANPELPDPLAEDWSWTQPHWLALLELLDRFSHNFAQRKRDAHAVDFADLEQFTLDLLLGRGPVTTPVPLRNQFTQVIVDEAQDINAAQDKILSQLSQPAPAGNRFLVGDVKQSIYRFRLADPSLFQNYAEQWRFRGSDAASAVLPLRENFRSAAAILNFVNLAFRALMQPEIGGVSYDDNAALKFGAPDSRPALASPSPHRVALWLHSPTTPPPDSPSDPAASDDESLDEVEDEARAIAQKLTTLIQAQTPIWDKDIKGFRPAQWSDVAILLRAPESRQDSFARAFARENVPLNAAPGALFTQLPALDILHLCQTLDNPLQDIPLAGVLRSPIGGFSDPNEFSILRMFSPAAALWDALHDFAKSTGPLPLDSAASTPLSPSSPFEKIEGPSVFLHAATAPIAHAALQRAKIFVDRCQRWARLARQLPMQGLLEHILDETGYEPALCAGPTGPQRRVALRQVLGLARSFDERVHGGLSRFVQFLEEQRENNLPTQPASHRKQAQLLSIHKSKGLEFPIVVVAHLHSQFNLADTRAEILRDPVGNIAPIVVAPDGRRYSSIARWLAERAEHRQLRGEELRLLYVAFTRARDFLFLSASLRTPATAIAAASRLPEPPSPSEIAAARSPLDWLLPTLSHLHQDPNWITQPSGQSQHFSWEILSTPLATRTPPATDTPPPLPDSTTAPPAPPYPFAGAVHEPSKQSVSHLRRRAETQPRPNPSPALPQAAAITPQATVVPPDIDDFLPSDSTSPTLLPASKRGTLHHKFLELMPLEHATDPEALKSFLTSLVDRKQFSPDEAASVHLASILAFWLSIPGQKILSQRHDIRRELPFTARFSLADFQRLGISHHAPWGDADFVVVQGVADLVVLLPDQLWLLDYKTDHVAASGAPQLGERYRLQLDMYRLALSAIFGRPVTHCWLHLLDPGITLDFSQTGPPPATPAPNPASQ